MKKKSLFFALVACFLVLLFNVFSVTKGEAAKAATQTEQIYSKSGNEEEKITGIVKYESKNKMFVLEIQLVCDKRRMPNISKCLGLYTLKKKRDEILWSKNFNRGYAPIFVSNDGKSVVFVDSNYKEVFSEYKVFIFLNEKGEIINKHELMSADNVFFKFDLSDDGNYFAVAEYDSFSVFDLKKGERLWKQGTPKGIPAESIISKNGNISIAVVDSWETNVDERDYLVAFDKQGKKLWEKEFPNKTEYNLSQDKEGIVIKDKKEKIVLKNIKGKINVYKEKIDSTKEIK